MELPIQEKRRLFYMYVTLQLLVSTIEELMYAKAFTHKLNRLASELKKEILITHKDNINSYWNAEKGEQSNVNGIKIADEICVELSTCSLDEMKMYLDLIKGLKSGKVVFEPSEDIGE